MLQPPVLDGGRTLAGTLVWEFGQNTLSLTPDLAESLGLGGGDPSRIEITAYRDRIIQPDLEVIYERLSRSFLRSEPMINIYAVRLHDGSVARVRSFSRWEMSDAGKPTRFVAVINEAQGQVHTTVEDEFIERLIELRFLAEKVPDPSYRRIVDAMMHEIWKHRRPA